MRKLPLQPNETLVVNFFAGPSTGKSTTSGGLFHVLKRAGINCEYAQEYAKDKTWEEAWTSLGCQPYVTGKQIFRIQRLLGKVRAVVTDSPVLTGLLYQGFGCTPSFAPYVKEVFGLFNNLNIFLARNTEAHAYNPHGRKQTEAEARAKDGEMRAILDEMGVPYHVIEVDGAWADRMETLLDSDADPAEIYALAMDSETVKTAFALVVEALREQERSWRAVEDDITQGEPV